MLYPRHRLTGLIIASVAAASHLCLAAPARAQQADSDEAVTAARGMRAGGFLFYPSIGFAAGYSDNLDELPGAPRSGSVMEVTPAMLLSSDWNRHSLTAALDSTFTAHDGDWEEGGHEIDARLNTRIDVYRDSSLELSGGYLRDVEPGIRDNAYLADAVYSHTFNRLTVALRGSVARYDYGGSRAGAGSVTEAEVSNYRQTGGGVRLSYEVSPLTSVFVEAGGNRRDHDRTIDINGFRRGSDGYDAAAGFRWSNGSKLSAELALGYEAQEPDDAALDTVEATTVDGAVTWRMSALTTLTASVATGTGETIRAGSAGYVSRLASLEIGHALRRHVLLSGGVSLEQADFSGVDLEEETLEAWAGLDYLLSPHMALTAEVRHTSFDSTVAGADWDANVYMLGLKLQR